jgi:hypothetical protein
MSISYDPTRQALLHPGSRKTLFAAGDVGRLSLDAICAECVRLVYLRFESDPVQRQALLDALALLEAVDWAEFNDPATGAQAFAVVVPAADRVFVVFRGTEPDRVSDIGADLEASTTDWPAGGVVHAGFAGAFSGLKDAIDDWLTRHAGSKVAFTGHSLGAAMATLAASNWAAENLITFGSPRVGNAAFVGSIRARAQARYVDCCDIVTELPPPTPWYQHAGGSRYIDRAGKPRPGLASGEIDADRFHGRIEYLERYAWRVGSVPVRDLADHAPINYVRALFPST